jgi:hypothetical protein
MDQVEGREPPFPTAAENREAYVRYLVDRVESPRLFVDEAARARASVHEVKPTVQSYRR